MEGSKLFTPLLILGVERIQGQNTHRHPELYSVLPTCGAQPTWVGMPGFVGLLATAAM